MVVLRVHGERFEVSEAALQRFGSESMLVQAAAHEGEQLNWPFPAATFFKILEWANTGVLPQAGSLPQAKMAVVPLVYSHNKNYFRKNQLQRSSLVPCRHYTLTNTPAL